MTFEEWWNKYRLDFGPYLYGRSLAPYEDLAHTAWRAAQPQWLPIETAPKAKEGESVITVVLLELDGRLSSTYIGYYSPTQRYWVSEMSEKERHPTHWSPLPDMIVEGSLE